jgi:uncharacterized protein YjiK
MKKFLLISISLIVVLSAILHLTDKDDQFFYWINAWLHADKKPSDVIWLQSYHLEGQPQQLSCVTQNLSGITYNNRTDTLFVITNNPTQIHEISTNGECIRKIELNGFEDTEGIVYLYDSFFAVLEEKKRSLDIIDIQTKVVKVDVDEIVQSLSIRLGNKDNKGFEGVAYDSDKSLF